MSFFTSVKSRNDWSSSIDAAGNQRVSSPHTIFDVQNQYNTAPLFYKETLTGGGTSTHLPNPSAVSLNVGTTSGDKVVRQQIGYNRYIAGKSQYVKLSRIFNARKTNLRQRTGYFDAQNGLFFEDNGTNLGVVVRSYTSGSVVDTRVAQSSWNQDRLDGTGLSGINLDISKENIYWIDFLWLGGGPVRFGIMYKNQPVICHIFETENVNSLPFMGTANLPLRSEIENTGTTASISSFLGVCSAVITENSGTEQLGLNFSASTGITAKSITTRQAVLSIRPKATFNSIVNRGAIENISYELLATTNNSFFEIVYGGTLGGTPSWTSVNNSSITEYDVAGTTVTGGLVIYSGFVEAAKHTSASALNSLLSKLPLVLDDTGANPINLSIVCTSFTGTSEINASFNFREIY